MKPYLLNPRQVEDVTIMDDQRYPFRTIADETGISLASIQKHLLTPDRLARDYNMNVPVNHIFTHYGMNIATFYSLLDQYGIPRRRNTYSNLYNTQPRTLSERAKQKQDSLSKAVAMYTAGEKLYKIVHDTGIQQPALHSYLRRQGIPLRRADPEHSARLSADDLALAQDLRVKGVPMSRIARDLNVTVYSLRMQLSKVKPNE